MIQINVRLPELGRIRIGNKSANNAPQKLSTFRLTSNDRESLTQAAALFGGTVVAWQGTDHVHQWQLITKVAQIPIIIAPEAPSLNYEHWTRGGCQRRCDGKTCKVYSAGQKPGEVVTTQVPCRCDADNRECKIKLRASFMIPDVPGVGVWRFESGGYYCASEMTGVLQFLLAQKMQNRYPEAVLSLETRKVVRGNQTKVFPVVNIIVRESMRNLIASSPTAPMMEAAPQRAISAAETPIAPSTQAVPSTEPAKAGKNDPLITAAGKFKEAAKEKGYQGVKTLADTRQFCQSILEWEDDRDPTVDDYEAATAKLIGGQS